MDLTLSGDISTYNNDAFTDSLCTKTDTLLGLSGGSCTVAAGSVVAGYKISGLSQTQADSAASAAAPVLANSASASDYFDLPVTGVSYAVVTYSLAPPSAPPNEAARIGIIVGAVVGGIVGVGLIVLVACLLMRKKKKPSTSSAAVAPS